MADAETSRDCLTYWEICGLISYEGITIDAHCEFYREGGWVTDRVAFDLITMHALRWLCDRGWRTLFIKSDSIKCGYAPDGGICDLSITGPIAQTLCEAITRQLERECK